MYEKVMNTNVDFKKIRLDFPILQQKNRGKPLVYLDSAASAQKPKSVVNAIRNLYFSDYANIHRGIYELSERSSTLYEATRDKVKEFINALSSAEIVFVRGTTEGINLVAHCLSVGGADYASWQAGDEVILSTMEHHSNIVPWQLLSKRLGIRLKIIPITDDGAMDITTYETLFSKRTKLVAISHVSNALGTIN